MKRLFKAVEKQYGDIIDSETAHCVLEHGAEGGFCGFTYYKDTCKFALDNFDLIIDHIRENYAYNDKSVSEVVCDFPCLGHQWDICEVEEVLMRPAIETEASTSILNALSWYALEEVCHDVFQKEHDQVAYMR